MDDLGIYLDKAIAEQSGGNLALAADLYRKYLGDESRDAASEKQALANYIYCLTALDRTDDIEIFLENYFQKITWFEENNLLIDRREFEYGQATEQEIVSSLKTFGCALIRRHFPTDLVSYFARLTVELLRPLPALIYDAFNEQDINRLNSPLIHEIMTAGRFGPTPARDTSWIRSVSPARQSTTLPFHQDLKAFTRKCINAWVPLTPAGRDAPGLELLPVFVKGVLQARGEGDSVYARHKLEIAEADLATAFPGVEPWHPAMEPGDILLFLGSTVHRSYVTPGMRRTRRSLELRFV